jgi:glutathione S-transferase
VNLISKPKWFIEKNPTGKVPCIELKPGEILKESLIIADYLDEAYPEIKLYPNNLWAKAKDKLLINQFNEIEAIVYKVLSLHIYLLHTLHIYLSSNTISMISESIIFIFQLLLEMSDFTVSQQEMFNKFLFGLDMYERELEKRNTTFFGGSKPNMLDFMIWPCCERIDTIRILRGEHFVLSQERFPLLVRYDAIIVE